MNEYNRSETREHWARARRKALWEALVDMLTHRSGGLLPLEEVRGRLNVKGSHYRGLQHVPLDQIVGSEGRYADFDRRFLPRSESAAARWQSIDYARRTDVHLPPIELYKLGDVYFVKDGNHRVSVARQLGQQEIDAYVTEYDLDVPLDPSISLRDLLLKEEYADFLDWTQLARLRPEQRIDLSALGGYLQLINHINTHRYYMARERNAVVSPEDAITSWYDNVYRPVVDEIQKRHVLRYFPGRTEADLYLWIMQHRYYLTEQAGRDPGAQEAVRDYTERFGRRSRFGSVGEALQALSAVVSNVFSDPGNAKADMSRELLDFLEWSHLDAHCPDVEIRFSNPQDYRRLRELIAQHRVTLSDHLQRSVSIDEAVSDWCAHFYQPTVALIRERELLKDWPGYTEAELYLEAMNHYEYLGGDSESAAPDQTLASLEDEGQPQDAHLLDVLRDAARRLLGRKR